MENESKIVFQVKSDSRSAPYKVDVLFKNDEMFVHCNCPAGKFGHFCKHKIRLLQNDFEVLYDDSQIDDFNKIGDWIQKSDFLDLIFERSKFKTELREAEERVELVKRKMRPVEEKMAHAMKNGIKPYKSG